MITLCAFTLHEKGIINTSHVVLLNLEVEPLLVYCSLKSPARNILFKHTWPLCVEGRTLAEAPIELEC